MQCISLGYWLPDAGVTFISHVLRNSQRLAQCDEWMGLIGLRPHFSSHFSPVPIFPVPNEIGDENEEEKRMTKSSVQSELIRLRWFDFKMNEYKTRTLRATERQVA